MTAETRQTYTAEFTREAVRLVLAQGYGITEAARLQAIAAETRHSSGSRRMAKPRQDDGVAVGRDNARRLMRQAQVTVERRQKRGPVTTDSRQSDAVAPNVLARQFDVEPPDQVWGGDISYLWTTDGWVYLAV